MNNSKFCGAEQCSTMDCTSSCLSQANCSQDGVADSNNTDRAEFNCYCCERFLKMSAKTFSLGDRTSKVA